MKKHLFYAIAIACIFLFSCSKEAYDNYDSFSWQSLTRCDYSYSPDWRINSVIEQGLIRFEDGHYFFTGTEQQCEALSLDDSIKSYIQAVICKANNMIDEYVANAQESHHSIVVSDYTFSKVDPLRSPALTSQSENGIVMPHGTLIATSNASVFETFTAPIPQVGICANCFANVAILPIHFVRTTYAGGAEHVGTIVGNGSCNVAISMSNTDIKIEYRTTDSYGGICSWVGITSMQ